MSKDAPSSQNQWTNADGTHNLREADQTAHKALKLAEELKDTVLLNPLKNLGKDNSIASIATGIGFCLGIICLSIATSQVSQSDIVISTTENTFVIGGLMIGALIGLFLMIFSLTASDLLGNYILLIGVFISSLAFNIGVFILIVAIKTRRLV